jgi:hypothetical protein
MQMQRLNSYKDKTASGSKNTNLRSPNLNLIVPGARQPVIATALLDLPRFRPRQPVSETKYFSSDKAKV